ncbi:hypothetical protein V2J09_009577 [Rumex salicifolius]
MICDKYELFSSAIPEMACWILLRIDYSRLFWLLFGISCKLSQISELKIDFTSNKVKGGRKFRDIVKRLFTV